MLGRTRCTTVGWPPILTVNSKAIQFKSISLAKSFFTFFAKALQL